MKSLIIASLLVASTLFASSSATAAVAPPPHLHAAEHRLAELAARRQRRNALNIERKNGRAAHSNQKSSPVVGDYVYPVNTITSFPFNTTAGGGATLHADATFPTPNPANPTEKFPLVLFPNSWSMTEEEYAIKIKQITAMGYVCVEYQTRGWYASTGYINTAGPFDRSDGSELIDYILNRFELAWQIDRNNIAFAGISYGAGIALLMAGSDPRVKTAVAFSGWGNLTYSMYQNESPNAASLEMLVGLAQITGKAPQDLINMKADIINHQNMSVAIAYGDARSPEMYLDTYKSRNTPLFIANNYLDRFFNPQGITRFFSSLDVTNKFLLMSNGGHAAAEMTGILGLPNYSWEKGQQWLDAVLKGVDNGILSGKQVQFQYGDSMLDGDFWEFDAVPSPYSVGAEQRQNVFALKDGKILGLDQLPRSSASSTKKNSENKKKKNLFTDPHATIVQLTDAFRALVEPRLRRGLLAEADLVPAFTELLKRREGLFAHHNTNTNKEKKHKHAERVAAPVASSYNTTINYSTTQSLTQGGMIDDLLRSVGLPVYFSLGLVDASTAMVLMSEPLQDEGNLCGLPEVTNIKIYPTFINGANALQRSTAWQLYFYLYDVNALDSGRIISDGVYTRWSDSISPAMNTADGSFTIPKVEMRAICTSIPATDRVALGVVLYNDQFTAAQTNLKVTFDYSVGGIHLPFN